MCSLAVRLGRTRRILYCPARRQSEIEAFFCRRDVTKTSVMDAPGRVGPPATTDLLTIRNRLHNTSFIAYEATPDIMDGPMKELEKLRTSTENSTKGKIPSVESSLDSLLQSLYEVKSRIEAGTVTQDTFALLSQTVEARKKEIDEKQKEVYNAIARLGKALDKV